LSYNGNRSFFIGLLFNEEVFIKIFSEQERKRKNKNPEMRENEKT